MLSFGGFFVSVGESMKKICVVMLALVSSVLFAEGHSVSQAISLDQQAKKITLRQSPFFYKGPTLGASLSPSGLGLSLGIRQSEHFGVELE